MLLSFGDPRPFIPAIRRNGAVLVIQVTDLDEAREALAAGADVIVAQGTDAGGHTGGRGRSAFSFVPVVADLAAPVPVLAAGGIADGRGVAAALALGAAGALVGTRFLAALEALADPSVTKAIVDGGGEDTERSTITDIARGTPWPARYPARTLRQPIVGAVAGPGRRAGRRHGCPPGLPPGRRGRGAAGRAGVGQRGDRPHHRPAARGRPGRRPRGRGRAGAGADGRRAA